MASVQWFKRASGLSRPITWNIRTAGSNRPMSWTAGPEAVVNLLPQDVISAGYTTLTFVDDFTSLASIDMAGTGEAGRKWYRRMPFDAAPNNDTPTSAISIITTGDLWFTPKGALEAMPSKLRFAVTCPHLSVYGGW